MNSFLNFYPDYKINKNNFIFRSKILNEYSGFVNFISNSNQLFEQFVEINSPISFFNDSNIQKLPQTRNINEYVLNIQDRSYIINLELQNSELYINKNSQK